MFKPNFRYTDKMVNNLAQIAVAREVILNSPLIPKWEVTLRREAMIRSAHSVLGVVKRKSKGRSISYILV